ncbi:hypothetical protein SAMN05444920_1635 [Nonomuraea solani]|uniref:Uncharacterized protein n=1 Tax=Nonomuraea solani TaxID=1144553 RepID=A0A1H6F1U1_9ACTN|nr:hypothetical protein [Nonomuraea solani]SEH04127.1 hypothetical protein SAMN05444920_1635 [Nonomuraea solani]
MPEFHPALAEQGRQVIAHGLDITHEADLVPLSRDVIEHDVAAALFAHEDHVEWVVFEYDTDWVSLGHTAVKTADFPLLGQMRLDIRHDAWDRSRTKRWSPTGRHLIHTRVLRTERIAQLHVAARSVGTPHGWAIMVWRGRRVPAISVGEV